MTTQTLNIRLYFMEDLAKEKGLIVLGKLQMIDVLTPGIDGRRFLAYNLQSIHSKRCDKLLQSLLPYGGL